MTQEAVVRPKRSLGIALVVAALAATGVSAAVFFLTQDADEPEHFVASVADASADVRASEGKPKPSKKRTRRGGKTRVAGHGSGGRGGGADPGGGGGLAGGSGPGGGTPAGPSYEAALGSNNEQLTIGASTGPDLTDAQLSAPMSDGTFVNDCGAPDSMSVTVRVAIRMGRAVGVSVDTNPPAADVAGCIDRHVRGLSWRANPKMDSFVTTY
jgi:hypothetical protein